MLAVGGAVIKGPEEMMKDCDLHGENCKEQAGAGHDMIETDHDHSLVLQSEYDYEEESDDEDDHDMVESTLAYFPKTQPSNLAALSLREHPSLHLQPHLRDNRYTFGVPSTSGYDQIDDNGQTRPSRSRVSHHHPGPPPRHLDSGSHDDLGTLRWMQNLRARDFDGSKGNQHVDAERTIRASPKKGRMRKRVRSLSS